MITTSSRSKLASSTSSAPLQVHRGGGNPLNIVSLHCLTILYYYLLIPPALLITILFHVCQQSRVSFRVEEAGFEKLKSQILGYKKIDFLNDGTRDVQNANRLRLKLPKSP